MKSFDLNYSRSLKHLKWFKVLLFGFVLIFGTSRIYAQCKPFEKTILENNPCKIDYDALVLGYLQSALRMADGKVKVWGKSVDNSGNSQLIQPQLLDSINYPAMRGILLRYAIGSDQGAIQMIVLTTQGLFVMGQNATVINASLTSGKVFQKLIVNGKSDGLPSGVFPADVKMMFASGGALAITTYAGLVYTLLSQNTNWIQVETSNGIPLSNICVCRGASNNPDVNFIALKSDNTLWTWGTNTYLGNNTGQTSRIYATQMSKPNALDTIKMIGMTNALSYYALNTAGMLYSLGTNDQRQLGDFTTQERRVWIVPKKPNGDSFKDVIWISPNEHDRSFASINVLTKTGRLFSWGNDNSSMIGRDKSSAVNPLTPPSIDSNQQISFVGTGGNFSLLWKKDSLQHCFVGQKKDGSMGDGTTSTENVESYDCIRSSVAAICPYKPNAGSDQIICSGSRAYLRGINPIIGQWIAKADNPKYATLSSIGLGEAYVDFSDSAKGDYYFIFDEMLRDTVKITVNSKPSAGADLINQCGGQNVTLTGTSPATGTWTAQSGNPVGAVLGSSSGGIANVSFTNVSTGIYRFIYTASTCPDTMNVIVTSKPSAGADQIGQCGGQNATLAGTLPTTGTWTAHAGNPAGASVGSTTTGIATVNFTNTASGIYSFIYTANGCADTMTITVSNKPIAGVDQTGQCGGQNAITTGTFPTTGTWTAQTGNPAGATVGATSAGIATVNFANTSTGVYGFIYNANGCSDTMTIAVNNKPSAGADQINQCGGKSATLTGTLPTTGTWTAQAGNPADATVGVTSAGIANVNFANTASGVYSFIYTANGCTDTMTITVTNKPIAGADQIGQCGGQNATLTGTFPTNGTWTAQTGNPAGAAVGSTTAGIATVNFANTSTGVYSFIYTANGCSDTMTMAVNNKPSAGADQINQCGGKSATLTGTLPTTGSWTAQAGNPAGASVGPTVGGIATVNFANTSSGIYRFIYTANGCSDTMAITVNNKPIAGADQIGQCGGQNANLIGTSPATGIWTSLINNPAGASVGATAAGIAIVHFNDTSKGAYQFKYTSNSCSDTMTIFVNRKPIGITSSDKLCLGTSTTLTGLFPNTGKWVSLFDNPFGMTLGATDSGIAKVYSMDTSSRPFRFEYSANGCSDTIALNSLAKPNAGIDQMGFCGGSQTILKGIAQDTGSWISMNTNPNNYFIDDKKYGWADLRFSDSSNGIYQFIYRVNTCLDTVSIQVNNKPNGGPDIITLSNKVINLKGQFPDTGNWFPLLPYYEGMTLDTTIAGLARLQIKDSVVGSFGFVYRANGCSDTMFVIVSLKLPNNKPIAKDDSLFVRRAVIYQLNVAKNDLDFDTDTLQVSILRYTKVGSSSVSGNLILYFLNTDFFGTDTLIYQISDSKGGLDTAYVFFIRREYFIKANDDYIRTLDSTVKGNVLDNDNYPIELKTFVRVLIKQASKQSGSFELNSEGEFSYTAVKVQDKYDYVLYQLCAITDEQDTICDYAWIYLQNQGLPVVSDLISPNGDGNNDELVIKDIEKLNNGGMKIYNRMGDLVWIRKVYDNDDPFKGLGMDNENLPTGTYYYLLKYSSKANGIEEDRYLSGFIELQK
ncbi:MAG: gliding motility-associated C-terminal domain-containing protein [Bacteroidetes bacterium]|nr:gliding motility-associated C-terminal domain-containing protein [Bacteroidota bacterium]